MSTDEVVVLCNNVGLAVGKKVREITIDILNENPKPTRADVYSRISISDIVSYALAQEIGKLVLDGRLRLIA